MKLENSFEVAAPPQKAWALLMDVPRVVPCMPGATLTETIDDSNWKADVAVKLGPIGLSFAADVNRSEVDEAGQRVVLVTNAKEKKGRGGARAAIESRLSPVEGGTRVDITTDLTLSGAVAQYGRGMVQDVSAQLIDSFANCLQAQLVGTEEEAEAAVEAQAEPVQGLSLGIGAVLRTIGRVIGRLFGRRR